MQPARRATQSRRFATRGSRSGWCGSTPIRG